MKGFIGLVGLIVFLAVAYVIQGVLYQSVQDQEVVEWSNSLIWSALGAQSTVNFDSPLVEPGDEEGRWRISGEIGLRGTAGEVRQEPYAAVIKQICQPSSERSCWRLEALTIGQQVVNVTELELFETAEPRAAELPLMAPAEAPITPALDQPLAPVQDGTAESGLAAGTSAGAAPGAVATAEDALTATGLATDQSQLQPLPPGAEVEPVLVPESTLEGETQVAAPDSTMQQAPLTYVSRRELIIGIQSQLTTLGIDPGPIDGQMGPQTRSAIELYQQAQGLPVDGRPSEPLLEHLMGQQ